MLNSHYNLYLNNKIIFYSYYNVNTYFQIHPTRCNVTQFIYFCEMLYMFQAVPLPIIRSSKLYTQHGVLCQSFTATCHDSGR